MSKTNFNKDNIGGPMSSRNSENVQEVKRAIEETPRSMFVKLLVSLLT